MSVQQPSKINSTSLVPSIISFVVTFSSYFFAILKYESQTNQFIRNAFVRNTLEMLSGTPLNLIAAVGAFASFLAIVHFFVYKYLSKSIVVHTLIILVINALPISMAILSMTKL